MNLERHKKKIFNNIAYAMLAQGISLLLSVIMALIVPKSLGVDEFSYWQLFLFYSSFVGFFHLGVNDGIYLRIGGTPYENINYGLVGSQLRITFFLHVIIAIFIGVTGYIAQEDWGRRIVWIAVAIYMPFFNANSLLGYLFQAVNKTHYYSISIIIDKLVLMLAVIILLVLGIDSFVWYIIFYIFALIIALGYSFIKGHRIIFSHLLKIKTVIKEIYENISVGIKLMISNIASMLILGSSRIIVDGIWGIITFGKFSFALLLTAFFLSFIKQISMVLFPTLRQSDQAQIKQFYFYSRDVLRICLTSILLTYVPISYVLNLWIPEYSESLYYLALLLPICIYDGKMNMLCSTYFKVLRKERFLLKINLLTLVLNVLLSLVAGILFQNIILVIISMVISVAFRSIVSEIYLAKLMGASISKNLIFESLLIIIYLISTLMSNDLEGFLIYAFVYAIYIFLSRNTLGNIVRLTKKYLIGK